MALAARADLFAALTALWTADAAKLGDGADVQVRLFERRAVDREKLPLPHILVDMPGDSSNTLASDHFDAGVTFIIKTDARKAIAEQDAIEEGVRRVFDDAVLTGTDWDWADCQLGDVAQQPGDTETRVAICRLETIGSRKASVSGKRLYTRKAFVQFTPAGGAAASIHALDVFVEDHGVAVEKYTPVRSNYPVNMPGEYDGSAQFEAPVDEVVPVSTYVPIGVAGTIKIAKNELLPNSGYISGGFIFMSRKHVGATPSRPQRYRYLGKFTGPFAEVA